MLKNVLIKELKYFPKPPSSLIDLKEFQKEKIDSQRLIELSLKDPLIIANIFKISNSSIFGFRTSVDSLTRAIELLGEKFVVSIPIASSYSDNLNPNLEAYDLSIKDFLNLSSLATTILNNWISKVDNKLNNELFFPTFLQEIGKFPIAKIIEKSNLIEEFKNEIKISSNTSSVEENFLGHSCVKVTSYIFRDWNFSDSIVIPIQYSSNVENCPIKYKQKAQILDVIKTVCDFTSPLSDDNIEKALKKVSLYEFDEDKFLSSINTTKSSFLQNY